jgi:hypothetical protein
MKKAPNEDTTVSEFIEEFIFLEEKLKIDNKKYEKALDELSFKINKCQESLKNSQDEIELSDGLTNKSCLFITVIEARDLSLQNINLIGDSKISVVLSFQGEEQETNLVGGSNNPSWCESFKFKIIEPNGFLKIEVFENSNLIGKKSLGMLMIDLTDLKDQKKRINWFDLNNSNNNNINCGSIYLKLNCILNFRHFYQGEIEIAENQIRIFQNAVNITDYFVDNMNTPFGLLFSDNLENLINNQELKQADELWNYLESQKDKEKIFKTFKTGNVPYTISNKMKIALNKLNIVLIYSLVIFSLISLLERSDYVNLSISLIITYFFILNREWDINKYLKRFVLLIGISIVFDFIWFLIYFKGFFLGEERDPESGIKRFVYFVGICSCVIKCLIVLALLNLKKRKNGIDS